MFSKFMLNIRRHLTAALAMNGLLAGGILNPSGIEEISYKIADKMIEEGEK